MAELKDKHHDAEMAQAVEHKVVREYDYSMRHPLLDEYYGYSDFFNYGYWAPETASQAEASANLVDRLMTFVPDQNGRVLDVACGMGATTRHLSRYFDPTQVTGTNISLLQLQRGQKNAPSSAMVLTDAARMSFASQSFDLVVCVEAAFHFDTRRTFLAEAHRLLKPGGMLVLSDILFLTIPGRKKKRLPNDNFVRYALYPDLYKDAGFEHVQTIDARRECWGGFSRNLRQFGWEKLQNRELDWRTWAGQMVKLLLGDIVIRRYLLVSARKAV